MSIPVPLSHSGRCPSHVLVQVEEDLPLPPPPDLIQACLQKLRDFRGSALVIVPVLPSAPWWPEFRLVCTPLDVDLDIGQWVQGEWLKARVKTSYRAFSFSKISTPGDTKHPLP